MLSLFDFCFEIVEVKLLHIATARSFLLNLSRYDYKEISTNILQMNYILWISTSKITYNKKANNLKINASFY